MYKKVYIRTVFNHIHIRNTYEQKQTVMYFFVFVILEKRQPVQILYVNFSGSESATKMLHATLAKILDTLCQKSVCIAG
jgi:hypothetical protein